VVDEYERLFVAAVDRRLRADVPVVSYLSGGVDSSLVVAVANKALGRPIPTFTIAVQEKGLNEEDAALAVAKHLGCEPLIVPTGHADLRARYPELIETAEYPVIDTSCLSLLDLAKAVHAKGYKVALTGEGADEWLGGYPWFKINRVLSKFGSGGSLWIRKMVVKLTGQPSFPPEAVEHARRMVGGHNGWLDVYGLMSLNKLRFFGPALRDRTLHSSYDDLELPAELPRWHPFHREMYLGARINLPGHQLAGKGDRVAMHSSVEARFPFLDEDLIAYTARLHPRWKLRGVLKDKWVERLVAARWLPKDVAFRRKKMFRAPMDSWFKPGGRGPADSWIEQVLSKESIEKTGYFDYAAIAAARAKLGKKRGLGRTGLEMGLTAVTATQLWHHLFISGDLADLPSNVRSAEFGVRNEQPAMAG
jgi:asparagine synthase (glutamine-hydrolysing)